MYRLRKRRADMIQVSEEHINQTNKTIEYLKMESMKLKEELKENKKVITSQKARIDSLKGANEYLMEVICEKDRVLKCQGWKNCSTFENPNYRKKMKNFWKSAG